MGCFGYLFGFVLWSAFLAAGLIMLWVQVLQPGIHILAAQSWVQTPCTIVSSAVVGEKTYSVAIKYDYEIQGERYQGDRYSFFSTRTSGRKEKERIVESFPAGSQAVCYVNPGNPKESVINRNVDPSIWWGAFSIPFLLIGLIGYRGMLSSRRKPRAILPPEESDLLARTPAASIQARTVMADTDFDDEDLQEEPGPVTLKADTSRVGAFIGVLVFALFWNAIVIGFCASRISDWFKGQWQWMPELILIPFVLVGLSLLFAAFHSFLGLFNPVPLLTLSRRLIPLGEAADLSWHFEGSPSSISSLKLTLRGLEEARYTQGTNTHTDTAVFHEELIHETADPAEIAAGKSQFQIPTDSMHSLNAANNKIKWQIQLRAEIRRWPDVSASFPIRVVPHE
jgi:hypothetical protein